MDVAALLLSRGADPNLQAENRRPALGPPVYKNNYELTKLLLDNGADPNIGERGDTCTPIFLASDYDIIKLLIDSGADVNAPCHYKQTILFRMGEGLGSAIEKEGDRAIEDRVKAIQLLLDAGANPSIKTQDGTPAFAILRAFLEYAPAAFDEHLSADIKPYMAVNRHGESLLLNLLGSDFNLGKSKEILWLCERGFDINDSDDRGNTFLMKLLALDNSSVSEIGAHISSLVEAGANIRCRNFRLDTVFHYLVNHTTCPEDLEPSQVSRYTGHEREVLSELVRILIELGGDVAADNEYDETPLERAIHDGKLETARLLIENDAPTGPDSSSFGSALHSVPHRGRRDYFNAANVKERPVRETLALLIEAGADVNAPGRDGRPVLHSIIKELKDEDAAIFLAENGASTTTPDQEGMTAVDYAKEAGLEEFLRRYSD